MRLVTLQASDKKYFGRSASEGRELSAYALPTHIIWRKLYKIQRGVYNDTLCLFFSDKYGMFMNCPPLGGPHRKDTLEACFDEMDKINTNPAVSRIENIEERDIAWYYSNGYAVVEKFCEYLCNTQRIGLLSGDRFKSQRANVNYF